MKACWIEFCFVVWLCSLSLAEPLGAVRPITHQRKKSPTKQQSNSTFFFSLQSINWWRKEKRRGQLVGFGWFVFSLRSIAAAAAINPQIKDNQTNQPISINAASAVSIHFDWFRPFWRAEIKSKLNCWMACGLSYRAPLSLSIIYLFVHS